jgi:NitT/TauT family transport system substrate-binding protein
VRRSAVLAGFAGALVAAHVPARAQALLPMRISTLPFDAGSEIFYGIDMGFFAKAGIDAKLETQQSGPAVAAAVASGAIDAGFSNVVSIAAAYKRGIPFAFIACGAIYTSAAPSSVLMVRSDAPIHSGKDLNGKTVGTNGLKNIGQYAPALWIDRNGGDSSTVKFVEVPASEDYAAIDTRRLDACNVAEPQITEMKPIARVLGKPYDTLGEGWMIAGYFSTREWIDTHADLHRRFDAAMHETAQWANANHERSAEILAKYTKLDPKLIRSGNRARFGDALTAEMIQPSIDLSARYKLFDAPFPGQDLIYTAKRSS